MVYTLLLLFQFPDISFGQGTVYPDPIDAEIVGVNEDQFLKGHSILNNDDYFVWGGSVVEGKDGKYHMLYSRWKAGDDHPVFRNGWLLGSEIAYAVSDFPDKNFQFVKVILQGRMHEGMNDVWDAQSVHNPHVRCFKGKFYLYYTGSMDPGVQPKGSKGEKLSKRDRIQQCQKIGVISFDTFKDLVDGNFVRPEKPLLSPRTRVKANNIVNPSPDGTKPLPDNVIVVNPSVVYRPQDGKYLFYFKGNVWDPGWRGVHGVAIGDSPEGPFKVSDDYVFNIITKDGKIASAEDPYVWYYTTEKQFWAVFKDFTGAITKGEPGLAMMISDDGINWRLAENPFFMKKELLLKDGQTLKVNRLERPQLLIDKNGSPRVLYAACAIHNINDKRNGATFNVQIKIRLK